MPSVPGHGGAVMAFEKSEDYDATVQAFAAAAVMAGPHRYGNPKARIFVQFNEGASPDVGDKAKAVIAGL